MENTINITVNKERINWEKENNLLIGGNIPTALIFKDLYISPWKNYNIKCTLKNPSGEIKEVEVIQEGTSGKAYIPPEIRQKPGILYIGIYGKAGSRTVTSSVLLLYLKPALVVSLVDPGQVLSM